MISRTLQIGSLLMVMVLAMSSCQTGEPEQTEITPMEQLVSKYVQVPLTADISHLSANEKEMLKLLFQAADIMDDIFWTQNIGEKEAFLAVLKTLLPGSLPKSTMAPGTNWTTRSLFWMGMALKHPAHNFIRPI